MAHNSSHSEQIEIWANFVKANKGWKKQHTAFINSQLEIAQRALKKIAAMPDGAEKLELIRNIRIKQKYGS